MPLAFGLRPTRRGLVVLALSIAGCAESAASVPDRPVGPAALPRTAPANPVPPAVAAQAGDELILSLGCAGCHAGLPTAIEPVASPLEPGSREASAVFALLREPRQAAAGQRAHPAFHLDDREAAALALLLGGTTRRSTASPALRAALDGHQDADDAAGARLFDALQCAACHRAAGQGPPPAGPSLALESARVRPEWLRAFLRAPGAIRPAGLPGRPGGRMPDFGLTAEEADAIAAALTAVPAAVPAFAPAPLSRSVTARINALFTARLSCTGCHALDGPGGRIGPDLSAAGHRLRPDWIRAMLEDPGHYAPGTTMPPMPGPSALRDQVASWLAARTTAPPPEPRQAPDDDGAADRNGYLSPLDMPEPRAASRADGDAGERLYGTWCSACHGPDGRGQGFNARYLAARPADHTDASAMAERPDDTLYDAIAAGAFFLDRSPTMPGFAPALAAAEIRSLVAYIRTLCQCAQPAWAGDGAPGGGPRTRRGN